MAFRDKIMTSLWGRRFGLQKMSTVQTGGRISDLLVGPDGFREDTTTAETTSTNLKAFGVSYMTGSSVGSSKVFTIDPPIQGVEKTLVFGSTDSSIMLKSANSETFGSSQGSTMTVLSSTALAFSAVQLMGLTTAAWAVIGQMSSAYIKATTTT